MAYKFLDEAPQESIVSATGRNVARQASNLGTRAIGLPGDVLSLVNEFIARPAAKASGLKDVPYEETSLGKLLPTTETHRKGIEKVSGDYLKPKNDVEKFMDDIIEDTALLFTPGGQLTKSGKVLKGSQKTFRNLSKSVGANFAGKAVEDFAGSEEAKDWTKMGSLFLMSIFDKPAAARQIKDLYKKAEIAIPEGATTNARHLESRMDSLINNITKGRPISNLSTQESFVVDQAKNVLNLIKDGKIPVDQAWAQLRTVNQKLQEILPTLPWKERKGIKSLSVGINHALNQTLEGYGKTNPAFAQTFHPAQEAISVIEKSKPISNWVKNNVKSPLLTEGLVSLFGSGIGETAATAAFPYKLGQLIYRINKSKALRQIYGDALKAAMKENSKEFNKYAKILDDKLQEEESTHSYRFLD